MFTTNIQKVRISEQATVSKVNMLTQQIVLLSTQSIHHSTIKSGYQAIICESIDHLNQHKHIKHNHVATVHLGVAAVAYMYPYNIAVTCATTHKSASTKAKSM